MSILHQNLTHLIRSLKYPKLQSAYFFSFVTQNTELCNLVTGKNLPSRIYSDGEYYKQVLNIPRLSRYHILDKTLRWVDHNYLPISPRGYTNLWTLVSKAFNSRVSLENELNLESLEKRLAADITETPVGITIQYLFFYVTIPLIYEEKDQTNK